MLTRPKSRKLIVADEPFRFINGSSYQDRVGGMLEMLAREMDVQFIIVTDDDWLKGIGKTIEV